MSDLITERTRISGGLRNIVAAATTTALHTISAGRTARIKKLHAFNGQLANVTLEIGYDNLAAAWTPVLPRYALITGMDFTLGEDEIPMCGNSPDGFHVDTTALTGFAGVISARASAAGAGVLAVSVEIEVEEF